MVVVLVVVVVVVCGGVVVLVVVVMVVVVGSGGGDLKNWLLRRGKMKARRYGCGRSRSCNRIIVVSSAVGWGGGR